MKYLAWISILGNIFRSKCAIISIKIQNVYDIIFFSNSSPLHKADPTKLGPPFCLQEIMAGNLRPMKYKTPT